MRRPRPAHHPAARPPRSGQGTGARANRSRRDRARLGPAAWRRRRRPSRPQPHPADALLAQLAYVVVNEAGASVYSTSQVGRDELPDLDATLRSGISIGRTAPGPAGRAGQDRAPEYRRRALPARRQSQAAQGDARVGHLELRQLRRRRPEHGERPVAAARLGSQPVDRPADRRLSQGARSVRRPRAVDAGRGGRSGDIHPGGGLPQDPRRREPARPDLDPSRVLPGRDQAAGEVRVRARRGARQGPPARAQRKAGPGRRPASCRASWRSASSRSATSSKRSAAPSATPAKTCPSRSSRRGS